MKRISHWISGRVQPGASGPVLPVHNPATGEQTGAADRASTAEVADAVGTAVEAARAWRATSLSLVTSRAGMALSRPAAPAGQAPTCRTPGQRCNSLHQPSSTLIATSAMRR